MLPLQHKKVLKKRIALWAQIAAIACGLHGAFFAWLLIVEHQPMVSQHFVLNLGSSGGTPLVFLAPPTSVPSGDASFGGLAPDVSPMTTVRTDTGDGARSIVQDDEGERTADVTGLALDESEESFENKQGTVVSADDDQTNTPDDLATLAQVEIGGTSASTTSDHQAVSLRDAIARHWAPPAGVSLDHSCSVRVAIGPDGTIYDLDVVQPSGVLMYDVVARRAVARAALPRWSWGRTLHITFTQ